MNIVYLSQFKDTSGYASAARSYLKSLDVYLQSEINPFKLKVHHIKVESVKSISKEDEDLIDKYIFSSEAEVDEFIKNNEFILVWHQPPPMLTLSNQYRSMVAL